LVIIGLYGDALVTIGLVAFNVLISVFQEIRTKRTLDKVSVLTWPQLTVRRDGVDKTVDPSQLVFGDVLILEPGNQIVVDGELVWGAGVDIDESLLTGESEPVRKMVGDKVLSGSFCVAGSGMYLAERVGQDSLANRLTSGARAFRQAKTPMQVDMELIVRATLLAVLIVGGPVLMDLGARGVEVLVRRFDQPGSVAIREAFGGYPVEENVRSAAVILALVPQGLALMVAVTYAASALRLIGSGVLVQQTNAMESLSHINVLCLDKTGTLTTNRLQVVDIQPIGADSATLRRIAGDFAANSTAQNKTSQALANAFPGGLRSVIAEVPFSSVRKWSSISFDDELGSGLYVLGAPDVLAAALPDDCDFESSVSEWTDTGRRVVLLTHNPDPHAMQTAGEDLKLPALDPIGLIVMKDELRTESAETLSHFAGLGVRLKLISGDDPRTVAALARQVSFPIDGDIVSGSDLDSRSDAEFGEIAARATIFGRTTPDQKERLIAALQAQGAYVAMTGDGVNDVPALKRSNLGIAMRSGSDAARGVADLVLLDDSFGSLPAAFVEGQRIVSGMQDIASLFLVRSLSVMLILIGAAFVDVPFPLTPRDNALLAMLTVGVPTLGLALWAHPQSAPGRLIRPVARFSIPAALTIAPVSLIAYMTWWRLTGDVDLSRSVLTSMAILCGLVLLPFVQPPTRWFVGGDVYSGDLRPTALAAALLGLFLLINFTPALRGIFEAAPLEVLDLVLLAPLVGIWAWLVRWVWRRRFIERLVGLESLPHTDLVGDVVRNSESV
jgi:cation-transporting ATPase E